MTALQRTAIGDFLLDETIDVTDLDAQNISQHLLPVDHGLRGLERVVLNDANARGLIDAQPVQLPAHAEFDRVLETRISSHRRSISRSMSTVAVNSNGKAVVKLPCQ